MVNENKNENNNKDRVYKKIDFDKNDNNNAKHKIVHISEKRIKRVEQYEQNYNLEYFRKNPPKPSELFNHVYIINNINIFTKENETLGKLNRDIIPNVYYNHMIYNRYNSKFNNKCKYLKTCIVQRNKKKLLSIIYYVPCCN